MLNPNEVANKRFDRVMGRGYKPDEVDSYLAQLSGDINRLISEKQDLEQKLMVLADKLEEYKRDEESLHAALLGAQKLGDSVVRDARAKAKMIQDDARTQAQLMIENAKKAIEQEQNSFLRIQREVATFKSRLQLMYKQHLELISSIPADQNLMDAALKGTIYATPEPQQQPAPSSAAPQVEEEPIPEEPVPSSDVEPLEGAESYYEEETPSLSYDEEPLPSYESSLEETYEPEPEPQLEPEYEPARPHRQRESRFGPLKFGKDFDIKRGDDKRKK